MGRLSTFSLGSSTIAVATFSLRENQENPPTSQDDESIPEELLTNIVTASPAAHSQPSPRSVQPLGPQPSTSTATPPVPMAVALEDTSPPVTTNAQPPTGIATLQQIAGVTKNDQAKIDGAVASTIATVLTNGLDVESRAKLDQSTPTISNCPRIAVMACNAEIYKQATQEVKTHDRDLQRVQKSLMCGLTVLAQALSEDDKEGQAQKHHQHIASALAMVADASHSLDLCRRRAFKSSIKEEYKALCTDDYAVDGMLFSQDLGERVKAVGDTNRISKSLSKDGPQPQRKRSFPFLGSRPGQRSGWSQTKSPQQQSRPQLQHPYQPPQRSTARGRGNQRLQYGRAGPQRQRRE